MRSINWSGHEERVGTDSQNKKICSRVLQLRTPVITGELPVANLLI